MAGSWLLMVASTAGAPSTLRVYVWRKLRALGGLYLQQQVCLLPDLDPVRDKVDRVVERVLSDGGQAQVLHIALTDRAEEAALVERFNAERRDEYGELLERIPSLARELASERDRGRVTFTEADESRADLERFQRWLARIRDRDYFDADGGERAAAAVSEAEAALLAFEADAADAELSD